METTAVAQTALTAASRAYTQALAGLALAQATDTQQSQQQIHLQIASITSDMNELTARYQALNTTAMGPVAAPTTGSINDIQLFPTANDDSSGGSRWQEISMSQTVKSELLPAGFSGVREPDEHVLHLVVRLLQLERFFEQRLCLVVLW